MHNKFMDMYKNLEFGQKVIIFVSIIAIISSVASISIMIVADNIGDLVVSNFDSNLPDINWLKIVYTIIILITISIFTLIL